MEAENNNWHINIKEHQFIIWDRPFSVHDENELALIFSTLKWEEEVTSIIHWNIIMELDEELLTIIKTHRWLIACLKALNEKNSFLLLVKISDILSNIFNNSLELWEILARLREEWDKIRLLKQMRNRWLSRLINSSEDLLNILEWVYDWAERETLDILWAETIRELFVYPSDIYNVLHYLENENKDYLIDLIWLFEISKKVKWWEDLLTIIKWISYNKVKPFLSLYNRRQIKEMFKSDEEFKTFFKKLSTWKEKIVLEYLWIINE